MDLDSAILLLAVIIGLVVGDAIGSQISGNSFILGL